MARAYTYSVRRLGSSLHVFPDGAYISQALEHPLARGMHIRVEGFDSCINMPSFNIHAPAEIETTIDPPSQEQSSVSGPHAWNFHLRFRSGVALRDSTKKPLRLSWSFKTDAIRWIPYYQLMIESASRAKLKFRATLPPEWELTCQSFYISSCSVLDLDGPSIKQAENGLQRSGDAQRTWKMSMPFDSEPTLETLFYSHDIHFSHDSQICITVDAKGSWTMPAGTMEVFVDGRAVACPKMRRWSLGSWLCVKIGLGGTVRVSVEYPSHESTARDGHHQQQLNRKQYTVQRVTNATSSTDGLSRPSLAMPPPSTLASMKKWKDSNLIHLQREGRDPTPDVYQSFLNELKDKSPSSHTSSTRNSPDAATHDFDAATQDFDAASALLELSRQGVGSSSVPVVDLTD